MPVAYLKAPNAAKYDQFGLSVAISGDTIVVGAPCEDSCSTEVVNGTMEMVVNGTGPYPSDDNCSQAGAAYVFRDLNKASSGRRLGHTGFNSYSRWVAEAYLKHPDAKPGDFFGALVSIDGDTIVVGANGSAVTFKHGGEWGEWVEYVALPSPLSPPPSPPSPPSPQLTVLETTVTLTATTDGTLNDAAAVAALAEELGVDAERITLFHSSSFDGTLEAGAAVEVKVVVAVEDASAVEAVEQKLGEMEGTDAFGASFEVTAVAAVVVTRPASSSPPPAAPGCDCGDADASDDCKATCDAIGAGLLLAGTALILVIALPIGGCCLLALCIVVIVCCCCRGKEKRLPETSIVHTFAREHSNGGSATPPSAATKTAEPTLESTFV